MSRAWRIVDDFAPEGEALRAVFDERFRDPRAARGDRFVWDWWHVPGQYTALRTPAWQYFPKRLYERLHRRIVAWGRATLGCHDISPPWLSCYVEGCGQQLHGDLPHGPWAFVYSLTRWKGRTFRGGETLIVRDEVLDFWRDFVSERSVEEPDVLTAIEPRFNRLTVFDPRLPHGVRTVTGTLDPREGRLVLHGWFVQPRPLVEGPLTGAQLQKGIDEVTGRLAPWLDGSLPVSGLLSLGFRVTPAGMVREVRVLSDTTRVPGNEERRRRHFLREVLAAVGETRFARHPRGSRVTLPLVFERSRCVG